MQALKQILNFNALTVIHSTPFLPKAVTFFFNTQLKYLEGQLFFA